MSAEVNQAGSSTCILVVKVTQVLLCVEPERPDCREGSKDRNAKNALVNTEGKASSVAIQAVIDLQDNKIRCARQQQTLQRAACSGLPSVISTLQSAPCIRPHPGLLCAPGRTLG